MGITRKSGWERSARADGEGELNRFIAMGIDPGEVNVGYAVIGWDGRTANWIDGGRALPGERGWVDGLTGVDVLAVEWPTVGKRQASKAVLATMAEASRIAGIAEQCGVRVERIPPVAWRKAVLGRTRRTEQETIDAIAKRVLPRLISGMPDRLVGHATDAAGVALCACRMAGRKVA